MEHDVLCCAECNKPVYRHEHVVLDVLNAVQHKNCYMLNIALKDFGTFEEIVQWYNFFNEMYFDRNGYYN